MQWPERLIAALARGVQVKPVEGLRQRDVLLALLDETARRAVWRAKGDPSRIGAALRTPYTPLGWVMADCVNGLAQTLTLGGRPWRQAVEAIHAYMEQNAEALCASYKEEAQPYDADIAFGF